MLNHWERLTVNSKMAPSSLIPRSTRLLANGNVDDLVNSNLRPRRNSSMLVPTQQGCLQPISRKREIHGPTWRMTCNIRVTMMTLTSKMRRIGKKWTTIILPWQSRSKEGISRRTIRYDGYFAMFWHTFQLFKDLQWVLDIRTNSGLALNFYIPDRICPVNETPFLGSRYPEFKITRPHCINILHNGRYKQWTNIA